MFTKDKESQVKAELFSQAFTKKTALAELKVQTDFSDPTNVTCAKQSEPGSAELKVQTAFSTPNTTSSEHSEPGSTVSVYKSLIREPKLKINYAEVPFFLRRKNPEPSTSETKSPTAEAKSASMESKSLFFNNSLQFKIVDPLGFQKVFGDKDQDSPTKPKPRVSTSKKTNSGSS